MKHNWTRGEAWGKGTAAILGGLFFFFTFTMAAGTVLPRLGLTEGLSMGLCISLGVPLYAIVIGWALLAQNGRRAWARVGIVTLIQAALTAAAKLL